MIKSRKNQECLAERQKEGKIKQRRDSYAVVLTRQHVRKED